MMVCRRYGVERITRLICDWHGEREGLTILSRAKEAETGAWTPPTLAGKILYVRGQMHIMALDLG